MACSCSCLLLLSRVMRSMILASSRSCASASSTRLRSSSVVEAVKVKDTSQGRQQERQVRMQVCMRSERGWCGYSLVAMKASLLGDSAILRLDLLTEGVDDASVVHWDRTRRPRGPLPFRPHAAGCRAQAPLVGQSPESSERKRLAFGARDECQGCACRHSSRRAIFTPQRLYRAHFNRSNGGRGRGSSQPRRYCEYAAVSPDWSQ